MQEHLHKSFFYEIMNLMKHGRIMSLDYGEVRIGIAMSDLLQTIASPFETYRRKEQEQDIAYLSKLAKENEVVKIVVGLPLNMDGTEGERAQKTREFGEKLKEKAGVDIVFIDERLSSVEAEEMLIQSGMRREKRKEVIDKIAAAIILESYLK